MSKRLFALVLSTLLLNQLPAFASLNQQYLKDEIQKIEKSTKGSLGVGAYDIQTGESWYLHGDTPYRMQSVAKLPIAIATLKEIDDGKFTLKTSVKVTRKEVLAIRNSSVPDNLPKNTKSCTVRTLLEKMVSNSNNGAADILIKLVGGPDRVNQVLKDRDIQGIKIDRYFHQLVKADGDVLDTSTPKGICDLLLKLQQGKLLTEQSTATLLEIMHNTKTGEHRLKAGLPAGTKLAHKTGTGSTTKNGVGIATNDVGIVTKSNGNKVIVAVFLSDAPGSVTARDGILAAISRSIYKATE